MGSTVQGQVANSPQWADCLKYISRRTREQSYNTWLRRTLGHPNGDQEFKISVPNQFVADWIDDHFRELIEESFREVLGQQYKIIYVCTGEPEDAEQTSLTLDATFPIAAPRPTPRGPSGLNARYQFGSLVVGDFNQFACAAALAVSDGPGMTRYNPLYIYGGTGLGKTHIVQAIGNRILELFPEKRVVYATSEKFTSDFIAAISDRTITDFHRVYRDVDVLVIDDIQFFTGKESTQEQFFHTFNALYHAGKQIVLTSDRPPKEIKGLEERLLSRFSWGLVTDLQAPDLENRTAILLKKIESEGARVPLDVIRFIADRVRTNVRELEGALTRVLAFSTLKETAITLEMAEKVLSDSVGSAHKEITIEAIQKKTSDFFRIEPAMMVAKKKTAKIALSRQVAMYLSRSLTDNSLKSIGAAFGGRDHSTVIHACDLISRRMASDAGFREKIDKLSGLLLY